MNRTRTDDGQIILLALVFVTVMAALVSAVLGLTSTTTTGANHLVQLRAARANANEAVATLVQTVRNDATQGKSGGTCTDTQSESSPAVSATCASLTTTVPNERYVSFTATWNPGSGPITVLKTVVTFEDVCTDSSRCTFGQALTGAGEQIDEWTYGQ